MPRGRTSITGTDMVSPAGYPLSTGIRAILIWPFSASGSVWARAGAQAKAATAVINARAIITREKLNFFSMDLRLRKTAMI